MARELFLRITTSRNSNQNSAALWPICHKKVYQPIGRILNKPCAEEAGGWRHFCMKLAQNFAVFTKIQDQKFKKSKSFI
jgi:hypothetical protein